MKTHPDGVQELVAKVGGAHFGLKSLVLMNLRGQVMKKKYHHLSLAGDVQGVCFISLIFAKKINWIVLK